MNNLDETLKYYADHADAFADSTAGVDMEPIRSRFLRHLPAGGRILDLGCGSGRDTKAFLKKGFQVDAVDGSAELCERASKLTGIPVKQMLFQELDAVSAYDGIWACASILHLPRPELQDVLGRIAAALKSDGVLYTSFKYGTFEGIRSGRHFTDFTEETLEAFWRGIPHLQIIDSWITQDVRPGREDGQWINLVARRS